jgi:L-ascorbate metabolism protein UlaG (beta-lactamase superfamily)
MNKACVASMVLLFGMALGGFALEPQEALQRIGWYGQGSLRVELGGKLVWIDPVNVPAQEKADIILVTHDHGDHFSTWDIEKLSGPDTIVLAGFDGKGLTRIKPGDVEKIGELGIEAVPAYNLAKPQFHPKSAGFCGFILSAEGLRIYDAGDTERIPEMKDISCDIAFLPLGQTYTMNSVDEAVQAAIDVKAKIAIPFHYGLYEGTDKDAEAFVATLKEKGVQALRLKKP